MSAAELYRKLVPQPWRQWLHDRLKQARNARILDAAFDYDQMRFAEAGSPFRDFRHRENLLAYANVLAHSIEKGMCLPEPRAGFGVPKAEELALLLRRLLESGQGDSRIGHGIGVLRAWRDWNLARQVVLPAPLLDRIDGLLDGHARSAQDATRVAEGDNLPLHADPEPRQTWPDFAALLASRHSVRHFSEQPVDLVAVQEAVRLAQSTPTLCNRQSSHVHLFANDERGRAMLALQGGNNGFTDNIPLLAVVTSELHCFLDPGERNQGWVEGGMFAMTFVLALHANGLATCCLNWPKDPETDRRMHALSGIPHPERIIMLLAIGHSHPECQVTASPQRATTEILHLHGSSET